MAGSGIGKSSPRKEGFDKLTGKSKYIDDLVFTDMLHGVTVRSDLPRGVIEDIILDDSIPWDEFTIVQAADIPGENTVKLLEKDQPFLADKNVLHMHEPILLLAHPDKHMAEKARQNIKINIKPLNPIFSIEDSIAKKEILFNNDNIFKSYTVNKGDIGTVFNSEDDSLVIVQGEYETGAQEQLYIEPQGMIASFKDNAVTIWGSMQCPYYVHKAIIPLFDLPEDKVRIIQTETGGGFGGKEEYPSILAGHAALLSYKSGKPVKMIYSRSEDLSVTPKRHPSKSKIRTAHDKTGKLKAIDFDFYLDGGAYATLSAVVLSRGTIHAGGPYRCENSRIRAKAVATNHPPYGAFRGFGAPQSIFAFERHLDRAAKQLGITPDKIRKVNLIKPGDTTTTSQQINEKVDYEALLDKAFSETDYFKKTEIYKEHNKNSHIKKGIGFATFMHGAGFTGSGEKFLASVVGVKGDIEGKVKILSASTEIGQGTNTIFTQIAAEALGLSEDRIEVQQPDTKFVPDSGPTVASRTCMVVGNLVEKACENLISVLKLSGCLSADKPDPEFQSKFTKACKSYIEKNGELKAFAEYKQPKGVHWDDENYIGDAYATYAWAVYVADVEVDTLTYETQVNDFLALQEAGKVINPILAKGQIEGGVAQGIGYALYEKVNWLNGDMTNNQMTNYIMPTAMDLPPIRVFFDEQNFEHGPSGAKGIGELPMDGPAPAIINAVSNALDQDINFIPLTPESLFEVMEHTKQ